MDQAKQIHTQSIGEEIANAVSHGIGALLAAAGAAVMIVCASLYSDAAAIVSCSVYGFSLVFLYLMSTLYHALQTPSVKKVFRVIDHCSIFILILGSYAPICLALLRGVRGGVIFSVNAVIMVVGIVGNAVNLERWRKFSILLYLLMGWSILAAGQTLVTRIPPSGFIFLVGGGLCYSIGVIFYKASRLRFMHSVWHLFVLAGSVLHYFFILFYIVLK